MVKLVKMLRLDIRIKDVLQIEYCNVFNKVRAKADRKVSLGKKLKREVHIKLVSVVKGMQPHLIPLRLVLSNNSQL